MGRLTVSAIWRMTTALLLLFLVVKPYVEGRLVEKKFPSDSVLAKALIDAHLSQNRKGTADALIGMRINLKCTTPNLEQAIQRYAPNSRYSVLPPCGVMTRFVQEGWIGYQEGLERESRARPSHPE